ncbi:hypothetical protein [Conexibacter sp. CPCC 206217]|uniref:hypothetical protein n=1 Tax=Conexibacter sp. CPCC 206217 TaxID=3064574 RepID=UPI0027214EC4|nr:hypothetical protein [Conexibacter sp. CPCC 206217]MDO8211192.1 hypothetical protein [Conexibacter sp. CPCC 206217]
MLSVEPFGRDELLAALRRTRLRGFDGAQPYADATLELVPDADPEQLVPAQRYVLTSGVAQILELRAALLPHGLDPLSLDGGAWVVFADAPEERVPVIPPIVEQSLEDDGRTVLLVNDGMHRVYAARELGLPIAAVVVRGVPAEYPYYARALPDGWAGVQAFAQLPDGFEKKSYRVPDNYKALFRQFNEVFPGVQQERRKTNPDHLRA